jgi:hypothetical protein
MYFFAAYFMDPELFILKGTDLWWIETLASVFFNISW